jgi:multiple sugar transport system substrate-binding protein
MLNRINKNTFSAIYSLIIFLIVFVFLNCDSSTDKTVVVKFWAMGSEAENLEKIILDFEKENPEIKISVQPIPWTAAQEKLVTAFASDNEPDACQLGNTWVPQFKALDAIIELDEFVAGSNIINKEKYFEGIWDTNVLKNRVYGIPWYIDTRLLFYRSDMLLRAGYESPPKSWGELYDLSKKIKSLFPNQEKYAIYLPTNEWVPFVVFGLQAGANLINEENYRGTFSSPEFKKAFDFLIRFHKEKLAPIGISQVTNIYQAFTEEYFSMYISGPWNIPEFKKWMKGSLSDKWMTAPLPGTNGMYPGTSLAGGSSLVIFKSSEHKREVWKFFEFLSLKKTQLEFYKLINDLPAVKEAWEDSSLSNNKYMKAFYEQFQVVKATPKIPEWEQIAFSKIQQYAELASRDVMSVDEALKALDDDVNRILEKRRWLMGIEK